MATPLLSTSFSSSPWTRTVAFSASSASTGGQVGRPRVRRWAVQASLRLSLLRAISTQATSRIQQAVEGLAKEAVKYVNPQQRDAGSLEEALMAVPDLETIQYRVLRREKQYEIRRVESYMLAETAMAGGRGFDFLGSSQGFNTLADYLFGKNKRTEKMEMTTPVVVQHGKGETMEMTTPVISQRAGDRREWYMSFVMPSKYDESSLPLPEDARVRLRRVPARIVAAVVFSGFVTDEEVSRREISLRKMLLQDPEVCIKDSATLEVAQYNPPFTPPFLRRNEIILEVELKEE